MMHNSSMRRASGLSSTLPKGVPKDPTDVVPIGHTTVLTSDELNRIRTTLLHADAKTQGQTIMSEVSSIDVLHNHMKGRTDEKMRETLRNMSKTRMGGWNNTLDARRKQKETDRQTKIDEEEKVRQVMDKEEAAFQAAERKKAIQRANTLLYEHTERVKAFGSKLYLSDVMKEREMQMEIKGEITKRKKAEEKLWHERTIEAVRLGDMEEDKKREEARQVRSPLCCDFPPARFVSFQALTQCAFLPARDERKAGAAGAAGGVPGEVCGGQERRPAGGGADQAARGGAHRGGEAGGAAEEAGRGGAGDEDAGGQQAAAGGEAHRGAAGQGGRGGAHPTLRQREGAQDAHARRARGRDRCAEAGPGSPQPALSLSAVCCVGVGVVVVLVRVILKGRGWVSMRPGFLNAARQWCE
eukprot:2940752-Rhodomonas_salina.1